MTSRNKLEKQTPCALAVNYQTMNGPDLQEELLTKEVLPYHLFTIGSQPLVKQVSADNQVIFTSRFLKDQMVNTLLF